MITRPTRFLGDVAFIVLFLVAALGAGYAGASLTPRPVAHVTVTTPVRTPVRSCLSGQRPNSPEPFAPGPAPYAYRPPATLFGFRDSWGIISSSTSGESGLIGWTWPTADDDYMLPCGAHELAYLPGDSRAVYILAYTGYIYGLGSYESWIAPNGGRFAYLHLTTLYYSAGARVRGGVAVGVTGWPTLPQYANGYPGPADAHLCLVVNALGNDWMYFVQHRPPPKPPQFPAKAYEAYRTSHRLEPVPYLFHGKLGRVPALWWHVAGARKRCGSVKDPERWNARSRFERQMFVRCAIYHWPKKRTDPYKIVRLHP